MVFLFRDKSVVNILFLVILSMGVHAHFFFVPAQLQIGVYDGFFSVVMNRYLYGLEASWLFLLYQIVLLIQAIRFNLLLTELKMFPQAGYTTAMAYILLSGLLMQWSVLSPALFANFLLIWLFLKITRLYNQAFPKTLVFNIGLLTGITIFCYHPTAVLLPVVLFTLGIMRAFKLREWFILLMGTCLPYYFLAAYLFLNNQLADLVNYLPNLQLSLPVSTLNSTLIAGLSILAFSILIGIFFWQQFNSRLVIQIRKNWSALLVTGLLICATPFIFKQAGLTSAFLCLVPFSAFVSSAFSYPKRLLFPNFLFWLMVGVIVYNNWQLIKI